jgi:hypothetical protein
MYIALRDDSVDYRKNNNSQDSNSSEIKLHLLFVRVILLTNSFLMTQDDIDNRRLIMLIGIASVKPAEFVTFRIMQTIAGAEINEL